MPEGQRSARPRYFVGHAGSADGGKERSTVRWHTPGRPRRRRRIALLRSRSLTVGDEHRGTWGGATGHPLSTTQTRLTGRDRTGGDEVNDMANAENTLTPRRASRATARLLAVGALIAAAVVATPTPGAAVKGWTAIDAGRDHTCALTAAGGVECWGDNLSGQLGDGTYRLRWTAVPVAGLGSGMVAITAGGEHSCALTAAGGVTCWGSNSSGQLGDGSTTDRTTPVDVVGLTSGVASISAGYAHTCAVTVAGAALCWGLNANGALGDGTVVSSSTPVAVSGLGSGVASISAGGDRTCAVTTSGGARCWGSGAIGDGSYDTRTAPVDVVGLTSGVASISVGAYATCAVTNVGAAQCWGTRVGDGTEQTRLTPTPVPGLGAQVAAIDAGGSHTCARTTTGRVRCWGGNLYGEIGDGSTTTRLTPVPVPGLPGNAMALATGHDHTCALTATGRPKCWGQGFRSQIGDDLLTNRSAPTNVRRLAAPADSTPPVWTKLPTNAMLVGAQLNPAILGDCDSYAMPVKVSWAAADPESGVHHYAHGLEAEATDASDIVFGTSTIRTSWVDDAPCGGGGNDQEFFAYNRAGLFSTRAYWSDQGLGVIQDDSVQDVPWNPVPPLSYAGRWATSACNCWSGGTTQKTRQSAASVTLRIPDAFGGTHAVGLLMAKGPDRGKAAVFVDNAKVATIDTHSAAKLNRTVVWRHALAAGPHTVRVVNLATPGRSRIDVDAFVLMRK